MYGARGEKRGGSGSRDVKGVAGFIAKIQRVEAAENSGNLSAPSVKTAAILWRNEIERFKFWYGADDDATIARLMQELADKGTQTFVAELAVELQINVTVGVTRGGQLLQDLQRSVELPQRVALRVRNRMAERGAGLSSSSFPNCSPARPAMGEGAECPLK